MSEAHSLDNNDGNPSRLAPTLAILGNCHRCHGFVDFAPNVEQFLVFRFLRHDHPNLGSFGEHEGSLVRSYKRSHSLPLAAENRVPA